MKWPIPQLSQHAISSPLYFRVLPFPSCQWHRIYFPCSPLHPTLWSLAPLSSASHLYHILHTPHFGNACFLSLKFEATKLHSNVAHLHNTNAFSFFFFTLNFSNFYLVSWNLHAYRWGGFAYKGIKWREFLEFLKGKTYTKGSMATSWIKWNYFRPKGYNWKISSKW